MTQTPTIINLEYIFLSHISNYSNFDIKKKL